MVLTKIFKRSGGGLRPGWKSLLFVAASAGLVEITTLMSFALWKAFSHGPSGSSWEFTDRCTRVISLLALSWFFLRREGNPFSSIGYRLDRRWFREFFLGTLGGALIMVATALAILGSSGFHWVRGVPLSWSTIVYGVALYLVGAIWQETEFRGYAFQRLAEELRSWAPGNTTKSGEGSSFRWFSSFVPTAIAIAIMAAWFAARHWDNPGMNGSTRIWATINIGLAAVLFGVLYLVTRSLAFPIGVHFGWNWTQCNIMGFGVSGTVSKPGLLKPIFHDKPSWITGGDFGLEASALCTIFCVAAIVAVLVWKFRRKRGQDPSVVRQPRPESGIAPFRGGAPDK